MRHNLNKISEEEKKLIRQQHTFRGLKVNLEKFNKLLESKSGDVKPLINEQQPMVRNNDTDNTYVQQNKAEKLTNSPAKKITQPVAKKITQPVKDEKPPFTSEGWGNHFRYWVNQTFPKVAREIDLDKKGPYNNEYITKAWNYPVKMKSGKIMKMGEYYKLKNPEIEQKQKIESKKFKVPNTIPGAERINKELYYINQRPEYWLKPFFIADPKHNLVLAFDEYHQLIDYSQSVAGASEQPQEVFTYEKWCKISNLEYDPFGKKCVNEKVASVADSKKATSATPDYKKLKAYELESQKAGIYQVRGTSYRPGYLGQKDVENAFHLQTKDGEQVGTAIHGLVNKQPRITADKELSALLKKEQQFGSIPKEYLETVERMTSKYDLSAGCFNVDPKFVNNPKVLKIAKDKAFVFIMSETNENFLVKVEPENQDNFFLKLKGDGQNCKPMDTIGIEAGGQGIETGLA